VPRHDYVALGEQGIRDLLAREHAALWTEIEAKIAEQQWPGLPAKVEPHHLTTAKHRLVDSNTIETTIAATRGGRKVRVIVPTDQRLRKRAVIDAAARKRLLQTRFLTWASGSAGTGSGVIGKAGEAVTHAGLLAAAPYGYRLFNPTSGQVTRLLDRDLTFGSLDNAAILTTMDTRRAVPTGQYLLVVEVKNIRSWIYRSTAELYQLLYKAARLQLDNPERRLLPVLVCRRAQYMTNQMAEALGFYVIATKRQYVPASLAADDVAEVNGELGYDLEAVPETPPPAMVKHFRSTLQGVAARTAARWSISAQALIDEFQALRDPRLIGSAREAATREMLDIAASVHGESRGTLTAASDDFDDVPF
jgi:hypothetical protein